MIQNNISRLFVAINFETETRNKLAALQNRLRTNFKRGSFTLPENLHLTLSFLGDCNPAQTAAVKAAMDATSFDPFDIRIESVGRYKRDGGDIWWAGLNESKPLLELQQKLVKNLSANGFKPEDRKFSPHITLARQVVTDVKPWQTEPFGETAHKIQLMRSERIGGKLTYTSIYVRGKKKHPIVVAPYNPDWPAAFLQIKEYLMPHIGDLVTDIHHVGSTSVPGLSAKPIIDFNIEIASMELFPEIKTRLAKLGYKHEGDYGITGREVFKRETPDKFMAYHMYVCPSDSAELTRQLKLRDYLRVNPAAASEYGALKTALAEKYQNDIDAYIDGKTAFILNCLEAANP